MGNVEETGRVRWDTLIQSSRWPDYTPLANDGCALPTWFLRAPLPPDDIGETELEIIDVIDEILPPTLTDGCYELRTSTGIGDRWVDIGCHAGVFSIAAMMHGATTSLLVDESPDMLRRARWNVQNFSRLAEAMQSLPQGSILSPMAKPARVENAHDIINIVQASGISKPLCLKLDIQGSEEDCILRDGAKILATRFQKVLMEWHDPVLLPTALVALEIAGYRVGFVRAHDDVLMGTATHIVFASQEG